MSTTIDSLSIEIVSNIGQADVKIDALAKSLGRLKENSNLTKVTNNLGKLSTSLNTLKTAVSGLEVSKLQALSTVMGSLSGVQKLSGLGNAIKTLKKLPEVSNELNTLNWSQFEAQMNRLAKVMEPVAKAMDKIGNGFSRLPSKIKSVTSATKSMNQATRDTGSAMESANVGVFALIENLETVMQYTGKVIGVFRSLINSAIGWDGIQYRFGRTFGEDAEEVYQHILRINDALGINIQEFMQYSSMYGALLSGFGMDQDKVTTISVGLSELTYDLWAANNDVVKRYEDVATAVKSAITGEIEPIRNLGIALTEASLQEFIDSTNLAGLSIEKMTEAQKSEVRYAAMVNAAMNQGIVGTYAKEMQTAEGALRSLSQSFKTLTQSLGSLFIPLLQVAVPYVTAFVDVVTDAVHALAELLGIEIFRVDWSSTNAGVGGLANGAENAASGLGDAAKAAKKLQDYTMGFDELNVIDPNSGSKGSSGSGYDAETWGSGLDLETVWDDSVFAQATKQAKELKEEVLGFLDKWKTELSILGAATSALAATGLVSSLGKALGLGDGFLDTMSKIQKIAGSAIVITLQFSFQKQFFSDFMGEDGELKDYLMALLVGGLGTWVSYKQWGPGGIVIGLGVTAIASLSAVWENGGVTDGESATTALTGVASGIGAIAMAFKLLKGTDVGTFFTLLKEGEPVLGILAAAFPKVATVLTTVGTAISGVLTAIGAALGISVGWVVAIIAGVVAAVVATIIYWDEIKAFFTDTLPEMWAKFTDWLGNIVGAVGEWLGGVAESIGEFFSKCWDKVVEIWDSAAQWFSKYVVTPIADFFAPIVDWFAEWFGNIWQTVSDVFYNIGVIAKGCWQIITIAWGIASAWFNEKIITPVGNFFSKLWSGVKDVAIDAWNAIKSVFSTIGSWINAKVIQPVGEFFSKLWDGFKEGASKAWSGVKDVFGKVGSFFRETFSKAWQGIVDVFSVAGEIFVDIKDGVVSAFTVVVNGIIRGINKVVSIPFNAINSALEMIRDINILGVSPFTGIRTISVPEIPLLAKGGVVNAGQLFVANEAGPELVGNMGSKTAVMNNDQIVLAVSQGVYTAVRSALSDNSGNQNINVYLDGKQIYASVKKTEAQRGKTLMGNQLGYSY